MADKEIKIGIIGAGPWGQNYLKTLIELNNSQVKLICATKQATLKEALFKAGPKATVRTTTNYKDILKDKEIDAVAITSSGSTHYKFAKEALLHGKHVLVEKPAALHSSHIIELIKISNRNKKILMVGHIHRYNPGIEALKADIDRGIFGKIRSFYSCQFGSTVRSDIGAIWDFFPHSVSTASYLIGEPISASASGASYIKAGIEDIAVMDLKFPDGVFASSIASWLYNSKRMGIVIAGEKLWAVFDDYAKEDKLKYYYFNKGGGYKSPKIGNSSPLAKEIGHFLDCVTYNKTPLTDGYEALKVTRILEAVQKSFEKKGKSIKIIL